MTENKPSKKIIALSDDIEGVGKVGDRVSVLDLMMWATEEGRRLGHDRQRLGLVNLEWTEDIVRWHARHGPYEARIWNMGKWEVHGPWRDGTTGTRLIDEGNNTDMERAKELCVIVIAAEIAKDDAENQDRSHTSEEK